MFLDKAVNRPSLLSVLVFAALAVVLVGLVVTKSLAAYFAELDPDTAIWLNSHEPFALMRLADKRLALNPELRQPEGTAQGTAGVTMEPGAPESPDLASSLAQVASQAFDENRPGTSQQPLWSGAISDLKLSPEDREVVARLAKDAVHSDPMNARTIRILGQLQETSGNPTQVHPYMDVAARLSQRESYAVYWLMLHAYESRDYAAALRYADILLRTRSTGPQLATPVIARLAENKDASGEVKALLSANPPWRGRVFDALLTNITDARTPLDLLLALKDTSHPPEAKEVGRYLDFLVGKKFYDLAYYAWLQFLPSEDLSTISLLFNGSFEKVVSGQPFDWSLAQGDGASASRVERPDRGDQHALSIEFGHGRVEFPGVRQITMLAPGRYALKGEFKG